MTESLSFPQRVVRWLAIVGFVYAGILLIQVTIEFYQNGLSSLWRSRGSFYPFIRFAGLCNAAILLFGAIGLLRWKPFGRICMIVWALLTPLIMVANSIDYWLNVYGQIIPTTQPSSPPAWWYLSVLITNIVGDCAFPAIAIYVLSQREVKELWAQRAHGGFEVLPVARIASTDTISNADH